MFFEEINNVPDYAYDYNYVVARECEDEFWFWGAFDDFKKALTVAQEIGGEVFSKGCCEIQ